KPPVLPLREDSVGFDAGLDGRVELSECAASFPVWNAWAECLKQLRGRCPSRIVYQAVVLHRISLWSECSSRLGASSGPAPAPKAPGLVQRISALLSSSTTSTQSSEDRAGGVASPARLRSDHRSWHARRPDSHC